MRRLLTFVVQQKKSSVVADSAGRNNGTLFAVFYPQCRTGHRNGGDCRFMVSFGQSKREGACLKHLQSSETYNCSDRSPSFPRPPKLAHSRQLPGAKQNPWNPPDRSKYLL